MELRTGTVLGDLLDLRSIENPFKVVGPTTEKERVCIVAEWATNYFGQRTAVYDGLHKKRAGGRARADRTAPSQKSTATPRTQSCMRSALGMEASAILPAYIGICGQSS